ncbi:unnamed protein product [Rotaria sp. Silwood1]|nr:unnamed protein product [Rotaria sp. Silwood1]CAF1685961.1 unnamed protein product [Rotaria sp. Silwood1]CAF3826390.1 unnamed protein product [Rotaria sp. Silwood1]CAF3901789.1 unnamed protein product [Rotaria sp. Silwood1]CAF4045522.1 unnamed protein product [Rotaria sp. Silwood1]
MENKKLKAQIINLSSSSPTSQQTSLHSTSIVSPSKFFFQNVSLNAKRRATARMMVQKENLPSDGIVNIRNKFGINLSNQNLPTTKTTTLSKELDEAIEQFLNNDKIIRLALDKKRIIDEKQARYL